MLNDEAGMANDEGSPNAQMTKRSLTAVLSHAPSPQGEGCLLRPSEIHHARLPNSDFVIPSCFAIAMDLPVRIHR